MLRTLKEVVNAIDKKEQSANFAYNREWKRKYPSKEALARLKSEMICYQDCKSLISSSHLLDMDGRINEARILVQEMYEKGMSMTDIIKELRI